jgi:hypothetical protein
VRLQQQLLTVVGRGSDASLAGIECVVLELIDLDENIGSFEVKIRLTVSWFVCFHKHSCNVEHLRCI